MVRWYSLFSHTGRETEQVQQRCWNRIHLETAVTNNVRYDGSLPCIKLLMSSDVNDWLVEPGNVEPGSIITLNGYMRIIPAEVLEYLASIDCRVYNIHPAPICLYPELKGKDPQERLYEGVVSGKYSYIGVVIHEVDAGVDTGRVLHWRYQLPTGISSKAELYEALHEMGTEMWQEFFEEEMWKDGQSS